MFVKWLPLTDDNSNYGAHLEAFPSPVTRLITGRGVHVKEFNIWSLVSLQIWTDLNS